MRMSEGTLTKDFDLVPGKSRINASLPGYRVWAAPSRVCAAARNAAEWVVRKAGMWSFECRTRFPGDLPDTAERWRRCSVASSPPKAVDTMAHFERVRHSHPGFQR